MLILPNFLYRVRYFIVQNVQIVGSLFTNDNTDVSYFKLFRFATSFEYFLMFLGVMCTALKSCSTSIFTLIYGEFATVLIERTFQNGTSSNTFFLQLFGGGRVLSNATDEENRLALIEDSFSCGKCMAIVLVFVFMFGIFCVDLFNYTSLKQISRIRVKYFSAIIRQEIGWFDCATSEANVAVRISEDIDRIHDAIGEKVTHFLYLLFSFIISTSISFYYGWKLALVIISYVPILLISTVIAARFQTYFSVEESNACATASTVSEEVLGGVKTVVAFGGEKRETKRYSKLLLLAQKAALRRAASTGFGEGFMRFLILASNSVAYWFGFLWVLADRNNIQKEYSSANLMIIFLNSFVGGEYLLLMKPFLESFAISRGAGTTIFKVIDRKSKIDPMSENENIICNADKGDVEFQDVGFSYPSRADMQILSHLNAKFINGQTVALVGSSGNGKSTCLQLLQRFYDPTEGRILIDGHDIKDLNLSWLRSKISFVGQEPALFATTIIENIRYAKPDATRKEIEESAKIAGAHDFIMKLQYGYETAVGERGCQLSGGQKQRIAIARALITNPRILLLDEATSALDSHSEKLVQEALNKASKGRTTIVVSHRLSAICNADRILFIENGKVVEAGTHDELIEMQGFYYKMISFNNKDNESVLHNPFHCDDDDFSMKQLVEKYEPVIQQDSEDTSIEDSRLRNTTNLGSVFKRLFLMAKPEWCFFVVAIAMSILRGLCSIVPSILFGEFFGALGTVNSDGSREIIRYVCLGFLGVGVVSGFVSFISIYMINKAGVFLVSRIQTKAFETMLRQDMAWFDDVDNSVGALSVRLTGHAANVRRAIGYPFSEITKLTFSLVFCLMVSIIYVFKLALIIIPVVPLVILSIHFDEKCTKSVEEVETKGIAEIVKIATEAILNIRTVASLRQEPHIIARYCTEVDKVEKAIRKKLSLRGLIYSAGEILPFLGHAAAIFYGGILVANGGLNAKYLIIVSETLLDGFITLGEMLVFSPTIVSALYAANSLFQIIDRQPQIKSPQTLNLSRGPDKGSNILFKQIHFSYPTRPDMDILRNISLDVPEGKTVALVGPSGCGKSTCVQLLQRFYDPVNGQIFVGSNEITRDVTLKELRSKLSIVTQEPILFDRTIAENIGYGDNSRAVGQVDIVVAAKMANIHDFIVSLPLGYDTRIGSKGTQLSGGQKQRIAIARALVRNPRVLLLDEATSALDIASEKVVQNALDLARTGRTCIVIAHRLSTIQNADLICVIQNGNVCEQGSHHHLMTLGGLYSKLYSMQSKME